MAPPAENNTAERTAPFIGRAAGHRAERIEAAFKTAISALLEQLEAIPVETVLEYKYQIALRERRKEYDQAQNALAEKQRDYETLRSEIAKALRGESLFQLTLLRSLFEETEQAITEKTERLFALEEKLQNAKQLRRKIAIKQFKYCGLKQIFTSGTM